MKTYGVGWVAGFGLLVASSGAVASAAPPPPPGDGQSAAKTSPKPSADPLARRITMPALQAPLGMVLREIARQGGVALSYSPTRLPLDVMVRVPAVRQQSVAEVLAVVLQDQPIKYGVLAGQVVLWRRDERPPAAGLVERRPGRAQPVARGGAASSTASVAKSGASAATGTSRSVRQTLPGAHSSTAARARLVGASGAGKSASARVTPVSATSPASSTVATTHESVTVSEETSRQISADEAVASVPMAGSSGDTAVINTRSATRKTSPSASALTENAAAAARKVSELATRTAQKVGTGVGLLSSRIVGLAAPTLDSLTQHAPRAMAVTPSASVWRQRGVQLSLIPPLSTNGRANGQTVNKISLNLVMGYAAGVRGVEVGGGMNYVRDSVIGLQLGGIVNSAGGRVLGAQIAGVINTARGGLEGVQSAGLINISRGASAGWQSAGLINIAHTRSAPGLEKPDQAVDPLVQFAGLLNSAPRGLRGAQVAGLLNVAGRVKGVQIAGLLNIADTVAGVSLAPLNFVRRGYHALELSTESNWPLALTLKLGGSASFYTYFTAVSAGGFTNPARWGLGYGIGSELAARQRMSFSIDGQVVQFREKDRAWGMWEGLNMHVQLRPQVGWGVGKKRRIRLVAGPVLNVLVTDHLDSANGSLDSSLAATGIGIFANAGNANTRTNGWISASAGLRWRF